MTDTIVVLIEDTLSRADVDKLISLHADEVLEYRVLVPADTERPLLPWIVDSLSLGELREAWDRAVGKEPTEPQARAAAAEQLTGTLTAFEAAGRRAVGTVVSDDPIPALRAAVAEGGVREIAVVTDPHLLEDTFHRDWASRAREELRLPVLHLYRGTSELG